MFRANRLVGFFVVTCALVAGTQAQAEMYGFTGLSLTSATNVAGGQAQLSINVTDAGSNRALFTFNNVGSSAMSITDIYFDNGSALSSLYSITNGPGVSFSNGASPPNLPSGNTAIPPFVADFGMDSDPPPSHNGVSPGESVGITFNLSGDYSDLISELNSSVTRVGIHVQGFGNGGSETFVHSSVVPVPGALALAGLGMLLIAPIKKRLS